jgi:phytoene synthase
MKQPGFGTLAQEGFSKARAMTKKHAKTFYFASRFLPHAKRNAAYAVYAVCRITDDAVDTATEASSSSNIHVIQEKIDAVYGGQALDDQLLLAFKETVESDNIPKQYFDELMAGMHMDLNKNRYENFNELYTYCYRVAGVVGLIMLKIFGSHYKEAEKYAVDLGIAMQLTNILRDIKEDFERGRIYLPGDEMERFGVSKDFIAGNKMNSDFIALLQFQIARARQYYQRSAKGIKMINNVLSRLVVCMMMEMYAGILNVIEENDYDVFSQRAHVTTAGKLGIAIKILFKGYYL